MQKTKKLKQKIVDNTESLSQEDLSEVLDFVRFLKQKNHPHDSLNACLSILDKKEQKHLNQEIEDYKEKHPFFYIVKSSFAIKYIPELHDRLIAGTANYKDCSVITNDPKIKNSEFVDTVWG